MKCLIFFLLCPVQMSLAFAGALTSRAMFSRLSPQLLPRVQPLSLAVPAPRAVMQRTLQRRPIAMATAVGAAYTAGRAPVVSALLAIAAQHCTGCLYRISHHSSQSWWLSKCCRQTLAKSVRIPRCRMWAPAWEMACVAWP